MPAVSPLVPKQGLVKRLRLRSHFLIFGTLVAEIATPFVLNYHHFRAGILWGILGVAAGLAGFEALLRSTTLHKMSRWRWVALDRTDHRSGRIQ